MAGSGKEEDACRPFNTAAAATFSRRGVEASRLPPLFPARRPHQRQHMGIVLRLVAPGEHLQGLMEFR
jgi:hypothetical protein